MKWNKGSSGGGEGYERPPVGWAVATLAGIFDLGVQQQPRSKYGPKHQVCLWWELSHRDSQGKQFQLRDVVTQSLFEGAHLSGRVEAILNRALSEDERDDFDPACLIGGRAKLLLAVSAANPNGNPFVKMAGPVEPTDPAIVPEADYSTEIPRFVASIVGDEVVKVMQAEIAAGGGDSARVFSGAQTTLPLNSPPAAAPVAAPAPDALPDGWTAHVDPSSGKTYYAGPGNVTTWEKPAPVAPPSAPAQAAPPVPGAPDAAF